MARKNKPKKTRSERAGSGDESQKPAEATTAEGEPEPKRRSRTLDVLAASGWIVALLTNANGIFDGLERLEQRLADDATIRIVADGQLASTVRATLKLKEKVIFADSVPKEGLESSAPPHESYLLLAETYDADHKLLTTAQFDVAIGNARCYQFALRTGDRIVMSPMDCGQAAPEVVFPQASNYEPPQNFLPSSASSLEQLTFKVMTVTGVFESAGDCFSAVSGDFDGMGISMGCLQWSLGTGSLQKLIKNAEQNDPGLIERILGPDAGEFHQMLSSQSIAAQLTWARSHQVGSRVQEPWLSKLVAFANSNAFKNEQMKLAAKSVQRSLDLCRQFELKTERCVALMFDFVTQNGGLKDIEVQVRQDIANHRRATGEEPNEPQVLEMIVQRRVDLVADRWRQLVKERKLAIARGEGQVYGRTLNLSDFGIELRKVPELQ